MEVNDYNELFGNENIIEERFGRTIKVQLSLDNKTNKISRKVNEYQELVKINDTRHLVENDSKSSQRGV